MGQHPPQPLEAKDLVPHPINQSRAPDFTLSDHQGRSFTLSAATGQWLLLVFFRGHWCPYCRRYLCKLAMRHASFEERRVRLLGISPEPGAISASLVRELQLPFVILSDATGGVIELYGVRNSFSATQTLLPHPALFLIDPAGVLRFSAIDRNYKKRTTIRSILAAIDEAAATP